MNKIYILYSLDIANLPQPAEDSARQKNMTTSWSHSMAMN